MANPTTNGAAMPKVLVLGASGQIARLAIPMLAEGGATLTLFARNASHVAAPRGASVVQGDVLDADALDRAMAGQDVVYANLAGDVAAQAEAIVAAMRRVGVQRLIFIVSLGIYHELPPAFERWNDRMIGSVLTGYRRAADIIEESGLDYTLVRPAWLTDADEIDYETTGRDERFKGTEVSRRSVAAFVTDVALHPERHSRENVGIDKPGTDGDKPAFY